MGKVQWKIVLSRFLDAPPSEPDKRSFSQDHVNKWWCKEIHRHLISQYVARPRYDWSFIKLPWFLSQIDDVMTSYLFVLNLKLPSLVLERMICLDNISQWLLLQVTARLSWTNGSSTLFRSFPQLFNLHFNDYCCFSNVYQHAASSAIGIWVLEFCYSYILHIPY